ncbi:putative Ninja family, Jas TPL-binding domain-containing protein [Helianthus anomalus]
MEDDKRLDLSLSPPCGRPSAASKGKTVIGSDVRVEEADNRGSKLIDDFKNFLDGSNHKEESTIVSQRIQQSKPEENVVYDLSKGPSNTETDNCLATWHVKPRTPHVSITADDVSAAENEDVADSEAGDVSKRSESTGVDLQSQRAFTISSEKEFKVGHVVSHGGVFPGQSANVMNLPYSLSVKESNSIPGSQQPVIPANLPLMFGYAPVQVATATPAGVTPVNTPKPFDRAKGDSKRAKEDGPSMHTEVDMKGTNVIDQSQPERFPQEYPAIRPGIAAELKFGGSGSSPNLPWVSTTGPGPNGKTISGVTYKYSGTEIRIVCACHGSHMSPEEFVQHATEEQPNLNGARAGAGAGLPLLSSSNPAASAQN